MDKSGILLATGTGEVEVLHFTVLDQHYAINVIKVKELLHIDNISKIPNSHPALAGVSLCRGEMIPIIDLRHVLEKRPNPNLIKSMVLVCEFNKLKLAFAIDQVHGINKISWNAIKKQEAFNDDSLVIGNIDLNGRIVMLLDFEKIVADISPQSGIHPGRVVRVEQKDRSGYKLVLADDSPLIRKVLSDTLMYSGFRHLKFFNDGRETLDYLRGLVDRLGKDWRDEVDLLITDIEMPLMDGHELTKQLKEHKQLRDLPIIIFSSLITDSLRHKGDTVGADLQISKPEIDVLVTEIDRLLSVK